MSEKRVFSDSKELESLASTVDVMLQFYGDFIPARERLIAIRDALLDLAENRDYPDE